MESPGFELTASKIAITDLPQSAYLLHATNCLATWGAGIAAELAAVFPAACERYRAFCHAAKLAPPVGRCLVIPPQDADTAAGAPAVHIVCLFTSHGYGRPNRARGNPGRDGVDIILRQTETALWDLRDVLEGEEGAAIYSPMFNSGAFKVPWERTAELIERVFDGWRGRWFIMEPPS